jgi:hypothetical protein
LLVAVKTLISPIHGDKEKARVQEVEEVCAVSASTILRVRKSRFERNTKCKSETLGLLGLYRVELSVCIIPPIIYNMLPPWTYLVLGNRINLLVCVCFRSSMHNKLVSEH